MEPTKKRAAIYARVATPGHLPGESEFALQTQIAEATSHCKKRGYSVSETHIYQEVFSGTEYTKRSQLSLLRHAAKRGEFDFVVVFAYDRIARTQDLVTEFLAELESFGVSVESVRQASPESLSLVDQMVIYARTDAREKTSKLRGM